MMCWLQRFSLYTEHYTEVGIAEATTGIGQECQESFLDSVVKSRQAECAEVWQTKKPYIHIPLF